MWLALSNSYLSIVADPADPDLLQVRARTARDLEHLFPGAKVTRSPGADYVYCVSIARDAAGKALNRALMRLETFAPEFDSERASAESRWRWRCGTCGAAGMGDPVSDSCPSCAENEGGSEDPSLSHHANSSQRGSAGMIRHIYQAIMPKSAL